MEHELHNGQISPIPSSFFLDSSMDFDFAMMRAKFVRRGKHNHKTLYVGQDGVDVTLIDEDPESRVLESLAITLREDGRVVTPSWPNTTFLGETLEEFERRPSENIFLRYTQHPAHENTILKWFQTELHASRALSLIHI